jgi:hypothetical protein
LVRIPNLPNDYIIQDENGHIFHLDLDKKTTEEIFSYHAGSIVSTDTSPLMHTVATLGEDGCLRIYEYNSKKCIGNFKYSASGTFLCYLPQVYICLLKFRILISREQPLQQDFQMA